MIEDIVKSIEEATIFRTFEFESHKENKSLPSVMEFYNYFDETLNRTVGELVKKYKVIGEQLLKSTEENIY